MTLLLRMTLSLRTTDKGYLDHITVILSEAKDLFFFKFGGGVGAGDDEGHG